MGLWLWIGQVLLRPLVKACVPFLFLPAAIWRRLLTFRTVGNQNGGYQVARNLLRVRPWHRFAVIELPFPEEALEVR